MQRSGNLEQHSSNRFIDPQLHREGARAKLPARTNPYWRQLRDGGYIGYRKGVGGEEHWLARWRFEDGLRKQVALGSAAVLTYDEAVAKALKKFEKWKVGGARTSWTVKQACEAYVEDRRNMKGERTATDSEKRFKARVYQTPIASMLVSELRLGHMTLWRDSLAATGLHKSTVNRDMRSVKAALNYACKQGMCDSNAAWSGKNLEMYAGADRRREAYLTPDQRNALIDACDRHVGALLLGLWYTGARPGELRKVRVADLDTRQRTLRLTDNKQRGGRTREFPLQDPIVFEFFTAQARDKLPSAPLFANADGGYLREHQLSNEVKRARRKAGLPDDIVAYTFRHCTIANWCSAGLPVSDVAKVCGTSIEMISDHYHKYIPSDFGRRLLQVKYF